MPSERAISQMVDVFTDVIDLGGTEERTAIVPNLSVIDAAPTGLTNFIIVQDDRDGDNILAKTVPGVVYTNNDKVNVLFIKGAEPIAFQQGSESSNAGLWEITPSTTTDIFYDKGKVGIGVSAALQLLHIESLSANAARMRITETGDTTSGHLSGIELYDTLTFKGGLFKKGDNHFIQLWDDTSARLTLDQSGNIGIGTVTPGNKLDVVTGAATNSIAHFGEVDNEGGYLTSTADHQIILSGGAEFVAGSWTARATDAALMSTDTGALTWFTNAGLVDGGVFVPTERMRLDTSGNLGIGTAGPDAKLDVLATTTQLRLTHTDGSVFADFTLDASHDLTINPSSTGQVIIDSDFTLSGGAQNYLFTDRVNSLVIQGQTAATATIVELYSNDGDGTDVSGVTIFGVGTPGAITNRERLLLRYNTTNVFEMFTEANGTGTLRPLIIYTEGNADQIHLAINGRVGIGEGTPLAKLHVDQASTTASVPVAYFDQADVSEEMFQFATTIGVGNAIEAVGAKTLTTTHFIKVTIPGGLTRYFPVGTIA